MRNGTYSVSQPSVEEELAFCEREGYIRQWVRGSRRHGTRRSPMYVVTEFNGGTVHLKDVQEAFAFIRGVYSMLSFDVARRKAEAEAQAAYEAQKEARLAAEREREELAVQVAGCPSCGQPAGERCLREQADPTPYAASPHRPRLDLAGTRVRQAVMVSA